MARTPRKNQEIIDEYKKAEENNEKLDKTKEKPTWKTISTAKDASIIIK